MKRRHFLQSLGAAAAWIPLRRLAGAESAVANLRQTWIRVNDETITTTLARQQRQEGHPFRGGFADEHEIYIAGTAAGCCAALATGYVLPESKYHASAEVLEALDLATAYLLGAQHADGTIDLASTNFHSTPDTAFSVEPLAIALTMVRRLAPDGLGGFQQRVGSYLKSAGRALSVGGIHTPNHRWVVCMALARVNAMFPDAAYVRRIDRWLAEGIDIDADGQYTERSVGVYSPLVDRCLITTARLLQRPQLYEPARENLRATRYFMHANGQLATEASTRQDQCQVVDAVPYYYSYRYMSLLDNDRDFAAMAAMIERTAGIEALYGNLRYLLEDPSFARELPAPGSVPTDYVKYFPGSRLARIRRGEIDSTILAGNASFFTFFKGRAALEGVRVASAFFGKGQFVSPALRVEGNRYVLAQDLAGPYFQPLAPEKISGDGDWWRMPRSERAQSEVMRLASKITIDENRGAFDIHFDVRGTDGVPVAIELAFRKGGELSGVRPLDDVADAFLLEAPAGRYQVGDARSDFGPGRADHAWTQLRGAAPKLDAQCVYVTGYTPFAYTLKIG
ncbi:MAG: hypothetical protein NTW96_01710 [Planctomycetia bacterium]|nr:hypothetical protein [Planctomycetia bacterium]